MANITITRDDPDFEDISWIVEARCFETERFFMRGVNIEEEANKEAIVATNGRELRFIFVPKGTYPIGNYTVIDTTKKSIVLSSDQDIGQYPNWRATVPTLAYPQEVSKCMDEDNHPITIPKNVLNLSTKEYPHGLENIGLLIVDLYRWTGRAFNPLYLLGLSGRAWEVYGRKGSRHSLEFHDIDPKSSRVVVVMPLRREGK